MYMEEWCAIIECKKLIVVSAATGDDMNEMATVALLGTTPKNQMKNWTNTDEYSVWHNTLATFAHFLFNYCFQTIFFL